jgi:hypothetical protein
MKPLIYTGQLHEMFLVQDIMYHAMELAALVALRLATVILCFARAKLPKVFSSLGHYILVQLHLDPAQLLPCLLMSVTRSAERATSPRAST